MKPRDCVFDSETRTCVNCGWHFPHDHLPLPATSCPHPESPLAGRRAAPAFALRPLPGDASATMLHGMRGPGDFLHDMILKRFGEGPTQQCGCEDRIRQMNAWGPQGCRENLETIVGWLVEVAKTYQWMVRDENGNWSDRTPPRMVRMARWMMRFKRGEKPIEAICRWMVLAAIRKAEKALTQTEAIWTSP